MECFQVRRRKKYFSHKPTVALSSTSLEGFSDPVICYFNGRVATKVTISDYQHCSSLQCNKYTINHIKSITWLQKLSFSFLCCYPCLHTEAVSTKSLTVAIPLYLSPGNASSVVMVSPKILK